MKYRVTRRTVLAMVVSAFMIFMGPEEAADAAHRGNTGGSPPVGLSIPLTLYNLDSSNTFATPFVTYGHAFADGDILSGGSITATDSNGNPVTAQMDAVSHWPSGCVRLALISHACAETFAASSNKVYTLGYSASPPNNTPAAGWGGSPATTMAANSDFKAVYGPGYDAGSNTYTVSLNTILSSYTQATAQDWGTSYPTGGWELTKSGPVCLEFHGWQYIKNDSTGFTQGYVRCDIWVKAWSPTGPFEVDVRTTMPNMWNTIATTSERHNLQQTRFATVMAVKNGSTVLKYMGGPNDATARTVANASFDTTLNRLTSAAESFFPQSAVAFSSTGALPSGLAAGTLYFPSYINGATANCYLASQQLFQGHIEQQPTPTAWAASTPYGVGIYRILNNIDYYCTQAGTSGLTGPSGTGTGITDGGCQWASATAQFIDQGSGTITAFPVPVTFPGTGWNAADVLGNALWSGSGSRPWISSGHDFAYLTTKSKFTPPYNINAGFATTNRTLPTFLPNAQFGGLQWNMSASGDGAGDQRIGYISNNSVASLYNPADPYYAGALVLAALSFPNIPLSFMNDESGGNPFIGNNGTNNSGTPYPNLPALIPTWCSTSRAGSVSSGVAARGNSWSKWSPALQDQNGVSGQGYPTSTGAHMPALWQIAYLRTGRPCFLDDAIQMANTQCFAGYLAAQTISGTTYYCVLNGDVFAEQLRALGWGLRSLNQCLYMLPSNHIFYPVIRDYYNDNAAFEANRLATFPPAQATFGFFKCQDPSGVSSLGNSATWMGYFVMMAYIMEVWRGGLTGATAGNQYGQLLDYHGAQWNLYVPSVDVNAINYIGTYRTAYGPTPQDWTTCYSTAAQVWSNSYSSGCIEATAGPPYITTLYDQNAPGGNHRCSANFPENCNMYASMARAVLTMHQMVRPANTTVSSLLASVLANTVAAIGLPLAQAGIQWYGPKAGFTDNYQTFAIYPYP